MKKNPYNTEELEFLAETAEKFAQKYIAPCFWNETKAESLTVIWSKRWVKWALLHLSCRSNTAVRAWADWRLELSMKRLPKQI